MRLSIINLVLNERDTVIDCLSVYNSIPNFLINQVIIDNSSNDGTSNRIQEWLNKKSNVIYVNESFKNINSCLIKAIGLVHHSSNFVLIGDVDIQGLKLSHILQIIMEQKNENNVIAYSDSNLSKLKHRLFSRQFLPTIASNVLAIKAGMFLIPVPLLKSLIVDLRVTKNSYMSSLIGSNMLNLICLNQDWKIKDKPTPPLKSSFNSFLADMRKMFNPIHGLK